VCSCICNFSALRSQDGPKSVVSVPKKAVAKPAAIDRKIEMLVLPGRQSNEGLCYKCGLSD